MPVSGILIRLCVAVSALTLAAASAVHPKTYHNPILPGFHPDPSCTRVKEWDDTFFCTTSSFNVVPGVPVFASKDLQNFRQISNVITRQSQLPGLANTNGPTSGIWAPTIRYHDGIFWVVTTLVYDSFVQNDSSRWDNVIFHTKNPYDSESWSDAVHLTFEGYDTSPFWGDDERTYMIGSQAWKVREMIQGFEINLKTGEIIGDIHDMWPGTGGIAPEALHLFHRDDNYYLMIAEDGTGFNHMVTIARAPSMWGPYQPNPANPVLTNANTSQYFQTVGHADLFNDTEGNWWGVALSTRSWPEYTYYPLSRETVLTLAQWKKGEFPTFNAARGEETGLLLPQDKGIKGIGRATFPSNWAGADDHIHFPPHSSLPSHFVHNRYSDPAAYTISAPEHANTLRLTPSILNLTAPDHRSASTPQTFVGRRQEHVEFTFDVKLAFQSKQDQAEAAVTVFLNQGQHFDMGIVTLSPKSASLAGYTGAPTKDVARYIRLRTIIVNSTNEGAVDPPSKPKIMLLDLNSQGEIHLQIEVVNRTTYAFRYATPRGWTTVGWGVSSQVSGGFVDKYYHWPVRYREWPKCHRSS